MKDTRRYVLAIDLGTSGPKVGLVSEDGELAGSATRSVETLHLPPRGAEQDPEELWRAVCEATRDALRQANRPRQAIVGVVCASQYSSVVPVDGSGRPTMNLILWMDGRGAPHGQAIYGEHDMALPTWLDVHGAVPLPSGADSLSHMLYVKHGRPDVYERTHKFLEAMDYLNARLTGQLTTNVGSAFMMLLTDNRNLETLDYHDELVRMSGIDKEKLPELRPLGSWIGPIRPEVAEELGLSPDTRVFSSLNDTQAAAIGTATFRPNQGALNIGTTCQILAHVAKKGTDLETQIVSMPSPLPGRYLALAENGLGGGALKHLIEGVLFAKDELGDHSTADPFSGLDRAAGSVPPGSGGMLFLPWLTGAVSPASDPDMRGGFINMSLQTTRAHLVRAVMEGVLFNLRWLLGAVEEFADQKFVHLGFSGGGAVSDAWSKMAADITQRPIRQLANPRYVNNLAGAFLAFEKLGVVGRDDIDRMIPVRRQYDPDPMNSSRYDLLFEQFKAAFERLQPVCHALASAATDRVS